MVVENYAIVEYSPLKYPRMFELTKKNNKALRDAPVIFHVERIRAGDKSYENIGNFRSVAEANNAIYHHAFDILKRTTKVITKLLN